MSDTRNLTLRTLDVLDALRSHLESVAHHHLNVAGFSQPELDFAS